MIVKRIHSAFNLNLVCMSLPHYVEGMQQGLQSAVDASLDNFW